MCVCVSGLNIIKISDLSGKPISTVAPFRSISSWASDFTGFIFGKKVINHCILIFLTIINNLQAQALLTRQLLPLQVVLAYDALCAILYLTASFNFFSNMYFCFFNFFLFRKKPLVSYDDQ